MQFSKSILEAINRGISLALDDFEDDSTPVKHIKSKQNNIDHAEMVVNHIFNLIDNGKATKEDLNTLKYWYKQTDLHYHVKSKKQLIDIIVSLSQISPNDIDLNWIDISNLTDLTRVFAKLSGTGTPSGITIDCSEWDTRHVEKFNYVFAFSKNITILANNWQFDSAKEFDGMFYNTSNSTNVIIDADHWNSGNVTTMKNMYQMCVGQKLLHYATKLDISSCMDFTEMFRKSKCTEDLSNWKIPDTAEGIYDKSDPFNKTDYYEYDVTMFDQVKTMPIEYLPKIVSAEKLHKTPMDLFKADVEKFCNATGSKANLQRIGDNGERFYCNDIIFPDGTTGFLSKYYKRENYFWKEFYSISSSHYRGKDDINETDDSLNKLIVKFNKKMNKIKGGK